MAKTGLLAKAKAKAATPDQAAAPATVWALQSEDPLNAALVDLVKLDARSAEIEGQVKLHKETLKAFADGKFAEACAERGALPGTPITIRSECGKSVNFVVQQKSVAIAADQVKQLQDLLGADVADDLLTEETTFNLNQTVLALPGVLDVVEKALEGAVRKLRKADLVTAEEAEALVLAETSRVFKPKTLARFCELCGKKTARMTALIKAMGTAATRFIKV